MQLHPRCFVFAGLTTEGLYRVSGNKTDQDNIQKQFDQGKTSDWFLTSVKFIIQSLQIDFLLPFLFCKNVCMSSIHCFWR